MHTGNTQDAFADLDLISEALAQVGVFPLLGRKL